MKTIPCTYCGCHAIDHPDNRLPHGVTSMWCLYQVEVRESEPGDYVPADFLEWCNLRRPHFAPKRP